jgi:hypothetical protein
MSSKWHVTTPAASSEKKTSYTHLKVVFVSLGPGKRWHPNQAVTMSGPIFPWATIQLKEPRWFFGWLEFMNTLPSIRLLSNLLLFNWHDNPCKETKINFPCTQNVNNLCWNLSNKYSFLGCGDVNCKSIDCVSFFTINRAFSWYVGHLGCRTASFPERWYFAIWSKDILVLKDKDYDLGIHCVAK